MPLFGKSKSTSPGRIRDCIGPVVKMSPQSPPRTTIPERHDPPLPEIPRSDGPPLVDRYIDYNRYTFAATHIPTISKEGDGEAYGYIAAQTGLVLGLEEVQRVVEDVAQQLSERGLNTPLLFSSQALDLSASKIRLLINSYISTISQPSQSTASKQYHDHLRLSSPHEAAWFLRWAMSRPVRLVREDKVVESPGKRKGGGKVVAVQERQVRGLVDLREYVVWRGKERANRYPAQGINLFFQGLPPHLSTLLQTTLNLLSRLASHSHTSGLTPTHLSTLFGPLIFGLTDPSSSSSAAAGVGTFSETHAAYVRASGALEHLLLAFIRGQEAAHERLTGDFPRTLGAWIRGYPFGIVSDETLDVGAPRDGMRKVMVRKAGKVVRSYSGDLVGSCVDWAGEWKGWNEVVKDGVTLTERHRLRLDLKTATLPTRAGRTSNSRKDEGRDTVDDGWGSFEDSGFLDEGLGDKLRFDLGEGAKQQVNAKRHTMTWTDFASSTGGFDRSTTALVESLTLDQPVVQEHLAHWTADRQAMHEQHLNVQKELPSFDGYDHALRIGEEWVEEPFLDVWADLVVSAGWGDAGELTYRRANWVIVECKTASTPAVFVLEERVPLKYQQELISPPKKPSIFKRFPRHSEPSSLQTREEAEFDARLKRHSVKVMTFSKPLHVREIGSPLPASPQTPRTSRGSGDATRSPRSRESVDRSPLAGRSKHASTGFLEQLNAGGLGEARVMRVDTGRMRGLSGKEGFGQSDADRWLDLLAANRSKGMHTSAPVVSSVPRRSGDGSGFRVLSRSSVTTHEIPVKTVQQELPQDDTRLKLKGFGHTFDPVSPSHSSFYCVATKSSYNVLPKDDLRVELQQSPGADMSQRSVSVDEEESELEYLAPPLSAVGSQWTGSPPNAVAVLRNDSVYTTGSIYSSDNRAPLNLGKPLPIPPTAPRFSSHRDTLFSVIEGYAGHSEAGGSPGGYENRWYHAAPGQILRPVPVHANGSPEPVQHTSAYSTYNDNQDIRLESVDLDDASSTWDIEADHSDDTVLDEIAFQGDDFVEESEDVLEPPPKLEDIEAIARQHSPGRYGHGIPLEFVDEESESGTEEDTRANGMPRLGQPIL